MALKCTLVSVATLAFAATLAGSEDGTPSVASQNEIRRTQPDLILFDPTGGKPRAWSAPDFFWLNEQILVIQTADRNLLATWTSERLDPHQLRVAVSRSEDSGATWSPVRYLDGDGIGEGHSAAWQVPVLSPSGRIYLLYCYGAKPLGGPFCGGFRVRCSDDHGSSWSTPTDLDFARSHIDSSDPNARPVWISIAVPIADGEGRPLIAFTRWPSQIEGRNLQGEISSKVPGANAPIKERYSHIELMRIDNLAANPNPKALKIQWLNLDNPITVPHASIPRASFAQEPYMVALPDGRMFMVMRTNRGEAWYTVSNDGGKRWRKPEPMRYQENGEVMSQSVSPCPVYSLDAKQFIFLFNNNNGFVFGAESRWDVRNRRPAYIARGEFRPAAHQPLWWSAPKQFIDNDAVPWGPEGRGRLEAAAYPSLSRIGVKHILWYPDRKGFLLGKEIRSEWLADMKVPH